jgi:PAS domain S-box-containing protein
MNASLTPENQTGVPELLFEESYKQISLLADAMPQLVWVAKANGEVVYYNSRVQEFAGAYKGTDGAWNWTGLLHAEDQQPTEKAWNNAISTGGIYEKEHRVQMKDGTFRWHLSRAFPQKNNKNEVANWFGTATDIHEQKLLEEKIKKAEERWRTALEATEIGTWEFDPSTKNFFLSDVAKKIRGFGPEMDRPFEMHRETIHPDDVQKVANAMQKALDRGKEETFSMEYRVFKKNVEQWCWIRSIGRIVMNDVGEPQRVIGIMQDVTEQKEAQEKLQYLATLTQNIADAVIGTDINHIIINWNKGAESIYGWMREEVIGKPAQQILYTQFLISCDEQAWREQFNTKGQWQGEVLQKRKNGETISILASVAKVTDRHGKHIGGVAVNKDITEQYKAAQLLKESEERFRVLTNTIPQIVWLNGSDGTLEYLNDQWYNITGQTAEEGLQNRLEMVHPNDLKPVRDKWKKALQNGEAFHVEYRLKTKSAEEYRWFFCNIQPLKNNEGIVTKWIGAASDIQHFKDVSVLLKQQVQERTTELNRLNIALQKQTEELRRSNEDLQQFAHVASHDLKEPLRKIKTYGSRLSDEFGEMLPEKAKSFLEKMDSAATRMSSMIDGVLGYSMLGATEQVVEPVNLNELLLHIEGDLEVIIHQKQAVIQHSNLPVIEGSAILLYQLFYNLINNSLKFSRSDVMPQIKISSTQIMGSELGEMQLLPNKDYVQISVTDNGIGFDQAHAQRIFKTFTRLNSKDKFEGTGLGLSLCQKIVQRHNGIISGNGVFNEGATFTIVLPMKQNS